MFFAISRLRGERRRARKKLAIAIAETGVQGIELNNKLVGEENNANDLK